MNITTESLLVFILLMPGFVSSAVLNTIIVRPKKERTANVVEALVFSFVVYSILATFDYGPVYFKLTEANGYQPVVNPDSLPYAIILAVTIALLFGLSSTQDWHMRILRAMKITTRTARVNTWLDVFMDVFMDRENSSNRVGGIVVTYRDGRRLSGWPSYYSDDPEEGLLYIERPAWIDDNDKYVELGAKGILLTQKDSIESIAFIETRES